MSATATTPPNVDTRTRILDAARRLFGERGVGDVTMAEVAADAGVARATVFNQFGSKHALVEAVTESVYIGYQAILDNAVADRATPVPVLVRALFDVMGRGIEADRRFYRTVFREVARLNLGLEEGGAAQLARHGAIERLVNLLTRGQARNEIVVDFDAADLAVAFDSLVFGTITRWLYDDSTDPLTDRMACSAEIFLRPIATHDGEDDVTAPDLRPSSFRPSGVER